MARHLQAVRAFSTLEDPRQTRAFHSLYSLLFVCIFRFLHSPVYSLYSPLFLLLFVLSKWISKGDLSTNTCVDFRQCFKLLLLSKETFLKGNRLQRTDRSLVYDSFQQSSRRLCCLTANNLICTPSSTHSATQTCSRIEDTTSLISNSTVVLSQPHSPKPKHVSTLCLRSPKSS